MDEVTRPASSLEQLHGTALTEEGPGDGGAPPPSSDEPASRRSGRVRDLTGRYGVILVLLAIPIFFSIYAPTTYFTTANFQTILSTQAVLVFLTLGLTMPLIVNEFDLSIGAQLGFATTLLAVLTVNHHMALGPRAPRLPRSRARARPRQRPDGGQARRELVHHHARHRHDHARAHAEDQWLDDHHRRAVGARERRRAARRSLGCP